MSRFNQVYRYSLEDPEGFWAGAAGAIEWDATPERILDDSNAPFYRWFGGGRLNTCHNALDRHVHGGRADQLALIYDSPLQGRPRPLRTASSGTPSRASQARWRLRASGRATA